MTDERRPTAPREQLRFNTDLPALAAPGDFAARALAIGVELEPSDVDALGRFLAILLAANDVLNLTAITEPAAAWERHILDALTLLPVLAEAPEQGRVADVGSGGGVPAIPLAIVFPALSFTLIEATAKKAAFLEAAVAGLGLKNVVVRAERAEEIGHDRGERGTSGLRESFDVVTARALGPMSVAAELCVPLCRVGGRVVLVKGQKADEELAAARNALELLGAAHAGTLDTPTGRLVVLEKVGRTPRTYPRPSGEPKRKPL
jgi:16S rRNA (guanine527-N7)-methyltransferase